MKIAYVISKPHGEFVLAVHLHSMSILYFMVSKTSTIKTPHAVLTHTNTSLPQPAMAVNIRGEKSRAGFAAQPELNPNAAPTTNRIRPMAIGLIPVCVSELLESQTAKIPNTSTNVPTTCGMTLP